MKVPAGSRLNFVPMELVDSGNLLMAAEVAVGGVSAEISPPQITIAATQTTAVLKRFKLALVVKDDVTSHKHKQNPVARFRLAVWVRSVNEDVRR